MCVGCMEQVSHRIAMPVRSPYNSHSQPTNLDPVKDKYMTSPTPEIKVEAPLKKNIESGKIRRLGNFKCRYAAKKICM